MLCRVHFLKEMLLLPALTGGDKKVIAGLACLMSEIGQAVSILYGLMVPFKYTSSNIIIII